MIDLYIYPFSVADLEDRMFLDASSGTFSSSRENVQLLVFKHLKQACARENIDLHTCDLFDSKKSSKKSYHIFMRQWPFEELAQVPGVVLTAYHAWESPVLVKEQPNDQFNILERVTRKFHRVYAVPTYESIRLAVPALPDNLPVRKGYLHQPYDSVIDEYWSRNDRKFLTLIANYQLCSLRKMELYTERIRAIRYFSGKGLDVYGKGWENVESYSRYGYRDVLRNVRRLRSGMIRGKLHGELASMKASRAITRSWTRRSAPHKLDTLSRYVFAICYESSVFDGFVTEKIFDCLAAGTIPIYLGAPDVVSYVPKDCFVDRREFQTNDDLHAYLKSLSPVAISRYRDAGREYFHSSMYMPFRKEAFATQVIEDVFRCARL